MSVYQLVNPAGLVVARAVCVWLAARPMAAGREFVGSGVCKIEGGDLRGDGAALSGLCS